jgi:hypothetical protein
VKRWLVAGLAVLTLAGCNILESGTEADVRDHRRRWDQLSLADYTFDFIRSCFCGGPAGDTIRIVVRGDSIVSATNLSPQNPPQPLPDSWSVTIDDLFDELQQAIDRDADEFNIEFDPQYHYPRNVTIDYIKNAIDDEMSFKITRFQPLP